MSIITEALRKAQKNRFISHNEAPERKEISSIDKIFHLTETVEKQKNKQKVSHIFVIVSVAFFLTIVLTGSVFVWILYPKLIGEKFIVPENQGVKRIKSDDIRMDSDNVKSISSGKTEKDITLTTIANVAVSSPLPVLSGIMFSSEYPTAILDDTIVSPGDMVSGFRVIKITPQAVEILKNTDTYQIKLK